MASLLSSITPLNYNNNSCMLSHSSSTSSIKKMQIRAVSSTEPENAKTTAESSTDTPVKTLRPKKPEYSMKKGQIVRVDKEKYLNSINYLSVGHPPYYKGLDYIYEDRGEVLDIRIFETGEYALVSISTYFLPNFFKTENVLASKIMYTDCLGGNPDCSSMATNRDAYQIGSVGL